MIEMLINAILEGLGLAAADAAVDAKNNPKAPKALRVILTVVIYLASIAVTILLIYACLAARFANETSKIIVIIVTVLFAAATVFMIVKDIRKLIIRNKQQKSIRNNNRD